jgi:cytochrome c1
MERMRFAAATLAVVVVLAACGRSDDRTAAPRPRTPGVRMSMDALHRVGGVPPGWKLTPPPGDVHAGREAFVEFGCPSCHKVEGEPFSAKAGNTQVGPELTGMGAHHPPGYFAEAILSPDAVLIEGPGYIGADGHSVMPDYPEMTVRQLGDIVAYLSSLTTGGPHAGHVMPTDPGPSSAGARPATPSASATAFFSQSYDVRPGMLPGFETWWKSEGARRFLAYDGVVSVDTYVDYTRAQNPYTTVFGFRDMAALMRFMNDPGTEPLGLQFDAFIGDHDHLTQTSSPMYRVPTLSAP